VRIFADSVEPSSIPTGGIDGVLAYQNGKYAWPAAQLQRFIAARKQLFRFDVIGNAWHEASILDVERYDATPEIANKWIRTRDSYRGDATIYIDRSNLSSLLDACRGLRYWVIIADWTGQPHTLNLGLPIGVRLAGVQYLHTTGYDLTAIEDDRWHPQVEKHITR
jgi:hypothetical protein